MMLIRSLLLFVLFSTSDASSWLSNLWSKCSCPTDDSYSAECLKSAIPPWPICLCGSHSAKYFVDKAVESAGRCCGDDLSKCTCPVKNSTCFQDKIGAWCDGVETCSNNVVAALPVEEQEAVSQQLLRGDASEQA